MAVKAVCTRVCYTCVCVVITIVLNGSLNFQFRLQSISNKTDLKYYPTNKKTPFNEMQQCTSTVQLTTSTLALFLEQWSNFGSVPFLTPLMTYIGLERLQWMSLE